MSKVPFPSPRVQRLHRPSIYVTPDWSFSSGVRNLFVFRAYPTMRVRLCLLNICHRGLSGMYGSSQP